MLEMEYPDICHREGGIPAASLKAWSIAREVEIDLDFLEFRMRGWDEK